MKEKKLLVIDDEELSTECLASIFEAYGYKTFVSHDGKTGLDLFRNNKPSVVIVDIGLPDMNGEDVCRSIKEIDKKVNVILSSGCSKKDDLASLYETGIIDGYIAKPIMQNDMMNLLAKLEEKTKEKQEM